MIRTYRRKNILLIIPGAAGFIFFYIVPFIYSFYYAMIDNAFNRKFIGLNNFIMVLSNKYYRLALKNTFEFTGIGVPLLVLLSFILALLLASRGRVSTFFRAPFVLPILIPSAAVVAVWQVIFNKDSHVMTWISSEVLKLGEIGLYRFPVLMFFTWKNTGFNLILFLAGFLNIPRELYEACEVEGAGWIRKHLHITFPLLLPTTFFVIIISIINSFKIFKEVFLLYGSYPSETIYFVQHYMNNHFNKLNYQNLTSGAIIFALMVYILVVIGYKIENKLSEGVW
ncbi:MAG: sugar ABC transporter permease [Clostridiaceae bacterium]|nr:sugar ABC transporter permease [Clostridiaceae bacterium]